MKKQLIDTIYTLILVSIAALAFVDEYDVFSDAKMSKPIYILTILLVIFFFLRLYYKEKK